MIKHISNLFIFLTYLIMNMVYAHGVHQTNNERSYIKRPGSYFVFFILEVLTGALIAVRAALEKKQA